MVDSGTVNGDKSTITSKLESYSSQLSGLSGGWTGNSHDKLIEQANSFKDEYSSALEQGLSSFATACEKYKEYEQLRNEIKELESKINGASKETDTSGWESEKRSKVSTCESLRGEIASALSNASSPRLEATKMASSVSTSTGSTSTTTTGGTVSPSADAIEPHSRISESERNARIAAIGGADSSNMTKIEVPYWDGNQEQTMSLTVNKNLAQNYQNAFRQVADLKWAIDPSTTAAYNHRTTRSGSRLSDHAYGSAVDVNWSHNFDTGDGSSAAVRENEAVIEAFASQGFYWGGDWQSSKDDMHFTYTGW